jgi:uncharacterized membrane protein YagU involved in acid resistance
MMQRSTAGKTIFWGGLIAGTMDITGACVVSWFRAGVPPVRIFQSVAAGFYGAASSQLGWKTAVMGLICHYLIATIWTTVYYVASRKITFLINQPIISGVLYGVFVHFFMTQVIVPLSAIGRRTFNLKASLIGMTIIIFCIGLPIAFIVRKFSK